MRIGLDARPLREKQTSGIPMYVRSLLREIAKVDHDNEYILYCHKDFEYALPGTNFSKVSGALTQYGSVWLQAELPYWLSRDHIDVFWGTQHILPLAMSRKIKSVLTVHDLVYRVFPQTMKTANLLINRMLIPPSVKQANGIVADSAWTLADVNRFLRPKNAILQVVHLGIGEQFCPMDTAVARKIIQEKFGLPEKFLLTVGTFEPRKNIAGLFKAFVKIADKIPHHLAVVGQKGWKNNDVHYAIEHAKLKDRIHLLDYVSDALLPTLYAASDMFVFPSLYEGFGLPPLEAMACGTPVVASMASSIPEIVENAAELVDPHDPQRIAEGIIGVLNNSERRKELIQMGLSQAAKFTWSKTAMQMVAMFNQVSSRP